MPKISIESVETPIFTTSHQLKISDINYGGHMGNERVLALVHDARIGFLESIGYSELNIEGVGLIMHNAGVQYVSEGFRGDEIRIDLTVSFESKFKFDFIYSLYNESSGKLLAKAFTGMATFDYSTRRVVAIPESFKEKIELT
mgnify:CR=1 FL=1